MNYRHIYHAGNFADVFKHSVLVLLINAMKHKDKAFCFIDTHAGIGLYNLHRKEAMRNPEFLNGIAKIISDTNLPPALQNYLNVIKPYYLQKQSPEYPGSPLIVQSLLRKQDNMIVNELHPDDFKILSDLFSKDRRVHCHHRNAYELLPAILPPSPARALILVDPPFEIKDEFKNLENCLLKSLKRFPHGVYAIWHPIKSHAHSVSISKLIKKITRPTLQLELVLPKDPSSPGGLSGSGLIIINPPWKIEQDIDSIKSYLQRSFT